MEVKGGERALRGGGGGITAEFVTEKFEEFVRLTPAPISNVNDIQVGGFFYSLASLHGCIHKLLFKSFEFRKRNLNVKNGTKQKLGQGFLDGFVLISHCNFRRLAGTPEPGIWNRRLFCSRN